MGNPFQSALLNGGVLPPTNPIQPQAQPTPQPVQPGSQQDSLVQSMVNASQLGQQRYQQEATQRDQMAAQLQNLQAQRAGTAPMASGEYLQEPKTRWSPQFKPMNSVGNVLGDIGKGLLLGLSATGPGRAVEEAYYEPGERRYARQAGSLAQQIEEIQKAMGSQSEAMQSAAGLTVKPMTAEARVMVGQMNNATRQAHDQMWQKVQTAKQQIDKDVAANKITQAQAHDKIEQLINAAHDQTVINVAGMTTDQRDRDAQLSAFEQEYKINRENILSGYLGAATGILPTAPSQQPNAPPGPKAAGSSVNPSAKGKTASKGATHIWTPQGLQPTGK